MMHQLINCYINSFQTTLEKLKGYTFFFFLPISEYVVKFCLSASLYSSWQLVSVPVSLCFVFSLMALW